MLCRQCPIGGRIEPGQHASHTEVLAPAIGGEDWEALQCIQLRLCQVSHSSGALRVTSAPPPMPKGWGEVKEMQVALQRSAAWHKWK